MSKSNHQWRIEEFMRKAGQELPAKPCIPSEEVRLLRAKLILEEALETIQALGFNVELTWQRTSPGGQVERVWQQVLIKDVVFEEMHEPNLVEIADGCADISVVTIGTLSACGMDDQELLALIDKSNLDKFSGDAHRNELGKWIKPSDWRPPDIAGLLKLQGWKG